MSTGSANEMDIEAFNGTGLSLISRSDKSRDDIMFDGKDYPEKGPNIAKKSTVSGKRIDARTIKIDTKVNGQLSITTTYTVAADGKSITYSLMPLKAEKPMVGVYDRK